MLPQTNQNHLGMEDYRHFVEDLAVKHRAKQSLRLLMDAGSLATS